MAGLVDIRVYAPNVLEDRGSPLFERLVEAVSQWAPAAPAWQGLTIREGTAMELVRRDSGPIDAAMLRRQAAQHHGSARRLTSGVAFDTWRFSPNGPARGAAHLEVSAWGPMYGGWQRRHEWIDGSGAIQIGDPGLYTALIGGSLSAAEQDINSKVDDNIERLVNLLSLIVETVRPIGLKVFVDECIRLSLNAHYVYYQSPERVGLDLQVLDDVWRNGLRAYPEDPPLSRFDQRVHALYLHLWRSQEQRRALWEKLNSSLGTSSRVTGATVMGVLEERPRRFDYFNMGDGIAILNYPHLLNNFVDDFYIAVLEQTHRARREIAEP